MKVQVNSDRTIAMDARLKHFVDAECSRILSRFAGRVSRVEVHLSDVDGSKSSRVDKRCLIEARPKGARPRTATAKAATIPSALNAALGKMRRSLTTFFEKRRMPASAIPMTMTAGASTMSSEPIAADSRRPKKKPIYQARRKSWPAR